MRDSYAALAMEVTTAKHPQKSFKKYISGTYAYLKLSLIFVFADFFRTSFSIIPEN